MGKVHKSKQFKQEPWIRTETESLSSQSRFVIYQAWYLLPRYLQESNRRPHLQNKHKMNRALSIRSNKNGSSSATSPRHGFIFSSLRGTVQPELSKKLYKLIKCRDLRASVVLVRLLRTVLLVMIVLFIMIGIPRLVLMEAGLAVERERLLLLDRLDVRMNLVRRRLRRSRKRGRCFDFDRMIV